MTIASKQSALVMVILAERSGDLFGGERGRRVHFLLQGGDVPTVGIADK